MEERWVIQVKILHTDGRDEGNEWKQVDWDEQGGDQSVPVHIKKLLSFCFGTRL